MTTNEKVFITTNYSSLSVDEQEQLLSIVLNYEPNYKHTKSVQETNNGTAINLDKCSINTITQIYRYIYSIITDKVPNNSLTSI